jgi:RNA recognition motif-containing protein
MSNTKLYVGNLSFNSSENDIRAAFEQCGPVTEVFVAMDRMTDRPRGFAFVTMGTSEAAKAAIEKLNGKELGGRTLNVNEARPREEGAGRSSGGGDRREGGFSGKSRY